MSADHVATSADVAVQPHDMWAWVHEDVVDETPPRPVDDPVLAVLVTRNGAAWLTAALDSVADQTRRPDRVIAIDNDSTDDSRFVLNQALADGRLDAVYAGKPDWGFGQAVSRAIELDGPPAQGTAPVWLWLLHDDAVAAPDCLAELLAHVGADPTIDLTGPKLLQPSRRFAGRQISELGVSVAASGERELALAPGEIDQGQHEPTTTLGVSTCGMLVRREVFEALGGFDPAIPLFRDGVELGWRANLAGRRVVTSPRAVMTHRQVGRAGARAGVAGSPTVRDRAYGMALVASHARGLGVLWTPVRLVVAAVLRTLFFLIGKAPARAAEELRSIGLFLGSGAQVRRLRRRVRALRPSRDAVERTRRLRPTGLARVSRAWSGFLTWVGDEWGELFGHESPETSLDDLTSDEVAHDHRATTRRRPWVISTVVALLMVFLLALFAARGVIGVGHLASWRLLPAQDTMAQALRDYTNPIPGSPGQVAPPWLGLVALASVLTMGRPELLVSLLLLGAVPLSAVAAFFVLRRVAADRRTRLVGAIAYGLVPALMGGITRGDLGLVVTAIVMPLLGLAVLGWRRRGSSGFESWRGPFAVGLAVTVLSAFNPAVWVLAALAGLVAIVIARRRVALRVLVALVVPVALLAPWLPTLVRHPGRLLTGFDPVLGGTAPVDTAQLLIGRTPGPGLPPLWVSLVFFGIVWLLGLAGVALRPRAARGWAMLAVGALAAAVVVTRFVVAVPASGELARPQAGMWLMISFAALIALVAQGWDHVRSQLSSRGFGLLQAVSLGGLALATLATVVGLGWWVVGGEQAPLHRSTYAGVPAFTRQTQQGQGLRTLDIDMGQARPRWALTEGDGTRLGDTERGETWGGRPDVLELARGVVADLVSGRPDQSVTDRLVRLGVGHVWLRGAPDDVLAALGSLPGLAQVTADEGSRVWRVTQVRSRALAVTGNEVPQPVTAQPIPAGQPWRRVVLAEPADPRWRLTVDGEPATPVQVPDDPRQWFAVGERSGVVRYELVSHPWWAWAQLAGLVVVAVLAAPALRRHDPMQYARRVARLDDEVTA